MPALNIPVKVNLDDFKKGMSEATSSVSSAAEFIAKEFVKMNISAAKVIAPPALAAIGAALPPLVSAFGPMIARLVAFKAGIDLVGAAVSGARAELVDMVAIADKASNLNVSPAFFQAFLTESRGLKVSAEELEGALTHAFDATKEKSPIDLSKWETGKDRITDVEAALRVYNETVAKAAGVQLKGLVLFRDANSQEDKVKAVLLAMVQLKDIGQQAAALDLGNKMFGGQFVDRIRQGKTSAEGILLSMKAAAATDDSIFSNAMVTRAKAVDDQLKLSEDRLSRGLKPSWDDLAGSLLTIKGYWADVVDLIGKAVEFTNRLGLTNERTRIKSELDEVNEAVKNKTGLFGLPQVPEAITSSLGMQSPQDRLKARQQRLQGQLDGLDRGAPEGPALPKPSRGTGDKPTLRKTGTASDRDPFDVAIDGTDKRIAALKAETATIADSTAVRERAKTVAGLEEAAKRANTAAGLENTAVTDKQRAAIDKEADAMMHATAASEKAKIHDGIKSAGDTSLLSPEDAAIAERLKTIYPDVATALGSVEANAMRVNSALKTVSGTIESGVTSALTDMMSTGRSASQTFYSMSRSIVRSIDEMVIKMLIVAPVMRALQSSFGGGINLFGGSSSPAPGDGNFIGPVLKADGGYISGPGSSRSDSIPARLSNGEFVVNAGSTAKHRALLESMNSGHLRGFADGGFVSNVPSMPSTTQIGGTTTHISPSINVSVQGQAGATPAQHAEMGAAIAKAAHDTTKAMIADELRTQMRPGGVLRQ
jgi:hypothetical protein